MDGNISQDYKLVESIVQTDFNTILVISTFVSSLAVFSI